MDLKTFSSVFVTIFLAELGDKTQLSTLLLASAERSRLAVFAASSCALIACSGLATLAGGLLGNVINPKWLGLSAGVAFVVMGIAMIVRSARL